MKMPSIVRTGLAATAGLITSLVLSGAIGGELDAGAGSGWAAIEKCAALAQDEARHACMDQVLRRAGLLGQPAAAPRLPPPAASAPPVPTAAPAAPAAADASPGGAGAAALRPEHPGDFGLQKPPRETSKPREAGRLDVTLASVDQGGDGKLVLTTTDGAVWLQVESDPVRLPPSRGQTMVIERTLFGGFMCKAGRWVSFRCRRVR
jgi:hypothetical protein